MDATPLSPRLHAYFAAAAPPGVLSAYLFGSHAEGRSHRESDVDVGVLLDRGRYPLAADRFDVRVRLGAELVDVLDRNDVDVVILNDAPPELGRAVVVRGQRVHCADAAADHAYVRDIQLRAADLDIFLRRVRRTKLDALRR
ncbi:MAG: nucleotidyltransferase domain-containing protein [Gemmatimonadota bacterium]